MDFKQYFIYQADYQHWANDVLFNALDRLDETSRTDPKTLFFGSIHGSVDHLGFFYSKWLARLKGETRTTRYTGIQHTDWRQLKNSLRHEIRALQTWLEQQPDTFLDERLNYKRTLSHEEKGVWVRDALTHIFTYGSLERGHISAAASALGAPYPDMGYFTYRQEMGDHLENMRKAAQ
jgi:uncharacterized damage-inducible protein DinB